MIRRIERIIERAWVRYRCETCGRRSRIGPESCPDCQSSQIMPWRVGQTMYDGAGEYINGVEFHGRIYPPGTDLHKLRRLHAEGAI